MNSEAGGPLQEWRRSWMVVLAAFSGMVLTGIPLTSIGLVMEPIEKEFGWSRTEIIFGTSLVSMFPMVFAIPMGALIDRTGPRAVGIAAATLLVGAIGMISTVSSSIWHWWALWALVGVACSTMPTVWVSAIPPLFSQNRGLALALTMSGSGIATSAVPLVGYWLLSRYGWRGTYIGLAALFGVLVLPLLVLFFRSRPANTRQGRKADSFTLPGLTARQGFTSLSFWKLALAAFGSMSAGTALILNLVPLLKSSGASTATAAGVASFLGVSTISGRVFGGWLMDRFPASIIASFSTALAVVLPGALLLFPGAIPVAIGAVIIYGIAGGAKVPAVAYLASRHFGQKAFGLLYGAIAACISVGVALGPLMTNRIYDLTQSYAIAIWISLPVLAIAAILYLMMGPYPTFAVEESTTATKSA